MDAIKSNLMSGTNGDVFIGKVLDLIWNNFFTKDSYSELIGSVVSAGVLEQQFSEPSIGGSSYKLPREYELDVYNTQHRWSPNLDGVNKSTRGKN